MRLNALHLTNVRKFTGQRASITGIGPGITVVSEANEFGKSTFFDALHALFFEKYSGSPKPVKSLQPYAGGAVEVAAEIETDEGAFRVEKRFLARKTARILRLSDGATIAQDDAAER
ncbi:MAG: AAA family ATPase, partial [Rhodobacterales bacterium]|nr:AAA family ATPase [Rhodobacterales bacterium]